MTTDQQQVARFFDGFAEAWQSMVGEAISMTQTSSGEADAAAAVTLVRATLERALAELPSRVRECIDEATEEEAYQAH